MGKLTSKELLELVKLLRIDVFFMLAVFTFYMPMVTVNQLSQDKYCINTFSVNESICLELELHANDSFTSTRNIVLEKATTLKMYSTIIVTLPGIILSFFLGYWVDTYPGHIRYMLAFGPICAIFQNLILIYQCLVFDIKPMALLYANIPVALSGSMVILMTGAYTYTTWKTPPKYRAIRFAILELFLFISIPLATTVGGSVLAMKPWFSGQHRNYIGVFILSIISSAFAALWVAILLNDAERSEEKMNNNGKSSSDTTKRNNHNEMKLVNSENGPKNMKSVILDIINIRNVSNTLNTAFKKREHNARFFLLFTMVSMAVCLIGYMGESAIGFQFAQRVYHWNAKYYSIMSAVIIMIPAIVTTITPPILIHKFHLHDTAIGIIGSVSLVLSMFARGLILKPAGFFIGIAIGAFSGLLPICNRAVLARIIKYNEIGQIYALLSCIESAGPLVSALFYSELFNATIDDAPGIVYIASGFVVIFTLVNMVWLYCTRKSWDLVLLGEMPPPGVQTTENGTEEIVSEPVVDQENIDQSRVVFISSTQIESQKEYDIDEQIEIESEEIITGKVEIIFEKTSENE